MFHSSNTTGVRFAAINNDSHGRGRGTFYYTKITSKNIKAQFIIGLFPWLKRKDSSWSLRSLTKMNTAQHSVVSLPITIESNTSTIESEEEEEQEDEEQAVKLEASIEDNASTPPSYDDKCHPWNYQFPQYLLNRTILPREEEGNEVLPDYECTIQKLGFIKVKCEYTLPEVRSTSRSWRYLYVQIYGTMIMAYSEKPSVMKKKLQPIWKYSMHGSEATVASDYLKERHVVRLNIENGPQFLFNACTEKSKKDWIAAMETSMNISSDLDVRSMPQFITLLSRRNRAHGSRQLRVADAEDSALL